MHPATTLTRGAPLASSSCKLIVRNGNSLSEISQFVISGLQVGQQVVAMAAPGCLKEIAENLQEAGFRPEAMLRSNRLIFLTAPDCLCQFFGSEGRLQRGPFRRSGPFLRWISDWSWAYSNGGLPDGILRHQRCVHDFVRSLSAISLCTVHGLKLERSSLLACLADHRRVARLPENHL